MVDLPCVYRYINNYFCNTSYKTRAAIMCILCCDLNIFRNVTSLIMSVTDNVLVSWHSLLLVVRVEKLCAR